MKENINVNASDYDIESVLIDYFESKGYVNTKSYKIDYFYKKGKTWVGFRQNKEYFSIYLACYFDLLEEYKTIDDKFISFSKSAIKIKDQSPNKELIVKMLIGRIESDFLIFE